MRLYFLKNVKVPVLMLDYHKYDKDAPLTPYRFEAAHRLYTPGPRRGMDVELANVEGEGFVAGVAIGYVQRDKSDMVFHTEGMTILLDGEASPHAIQGHNVEDDFNLTWGFNDFQSPWFGCPWHEHRDWNDQDGMYYRFFGPDAIAFESSLVFRMGARGDDTESVVYYYRIPRTKLPKALAPKEWKINGLFVCEKTFEEFQESEYVKPTEEFPGTPTKGYPQIAETVQTAHGWIDLQNYFFARNHTATPLAITGHCAYARGTIESPTARNATLRFAIDDWAVVWVNGKKVATIDHPLALEAKEIPITLKKGANEILIKANNTLIAQNRRLWVFNCAVISDGNAAR